MRKPSPAQRSAATGVLLVFCVGALIAGLGLDLGAAARVKFWIGDQPAAATAVGVSAALFTVLIMRGLRMIFSGRRRDEGPHADAHS